MVSYTLILSLLAAVAQSAPICNDNITLTFPESVLQLVASSTLDLTGLASTDPIKFISSLADKSVFSTGLTESNYTISGRYCEPEVYNPARQNTVQLLVHGATYTRDYWSGLGLPGSGNQYDGTRYSWVDYASLQGYPTFSIDRVCNGRSSHPEGLLCQSPLSAALVHDVIGQLRAGAIGGRAFDQVIFVGHSLGSMLGNVHAQAYPHDVDAYVLTGYTAYIRNSAAAIVTGLKYTPVTLAAPEKYGQYGATYLIPTSQKGFEAAFYYGAYSPAVAAFDYAGRGTLTPGEMLISLNGQEVVPDFTGDVFVLNGQYDVPYCSPDPLTALLFPKADCGQGAKSFTSQVGSLYPAAKRFAWKHIANTGHCLNLHTTAQESFKATHDFLAEAGY